MSQDGYEIKVHECEPVPPTPSGLRRTFRTEFRSSEEGTDDDDVKQVDFSYSGDGDDEEE